MYQTKSTVSLPLFRQTTLAVSLCLAFGAAGAQEVKPSPDDVRKDLYTVENSLSLGLGHQFSDNRRFGQYRGMTDDGTYGLLDLNLVSRDEATGRWLKVKANNFGLRLDHERQGDWSYYIQGNQASRSEPLVVKTGLQGIGTASQIVSAAAAAKREVDLKVDHNIYALGLRKFFGEGFDVRISAKQDDKSGARMYGRGTVGTMEFLTEPVDSVTRQWEVVASYANRKLQLSGGYSGSSYDNNISVLNSTGGNSAPAAFGASYLMALPLSNHAHQLHLAGGYSWSDSTRSSFKLSRSVAYQNETFDPMFNTVRFAGSPDSLNGKVTTTLAFTDLTMRPMAKLDLTGSLRYEDRDDQTPQAKYLDLTPASAHEPNANSAGISGFNKPRSLKQLKAMLEASYKLDGGYRLIGTLEQEDLERNGITGATNGGITPIRVAYREKTKETTERVELKRSMSETLNGGIALSHSNRGGSDYVPDTFPATVNYANQVNSLMFADRSRSKVRISADWIPAEQWSLQILADYSDDTYSGRNLGPRDGTAQFVSGDLSYQINDKWSFTSWLSQEHIQAKQSTRSSANATAVFWDADVRDRSTAWGLGVKGKPRSNIQIGADLSGSLNLVENNMAKTGGAGTAAVTSLPEYYYRQLSLKLSADYALDRQSGIGVVFIVDRRHNNDWTWQNWTYTDGTKVTNVGSENSAFLGVSYRYRWR